MAIVMRACIILHNMIVQDERYTQDEINCNISDIVITHVSNANNTFASFAERFTTTRDKIVHHQLRNDLIEHLWMKKGDEDLDE
jgi:3-methyladenine DNA glycosylase AlkC